MNQTLNKGGSNTKTININVIPVKDDKQMIVGKPKTIKLK